MDLISPSLLAKLYPEALQEMPRVVLFRHGGVDRVKRRNFHREEVPKSKPLKKLKLSVAKDKGQFVDNATEATFSKQFVPKNTATSTKWAVLNFVTGIS